MRKRSNRWLVAWLACALAWVGCGTQKTAEKKGIRPDTAVIGLTADFDTFLELSTANSDALHVIENMLFLTLGRLDADLNLQPRLAKSWQVHAGGKEIEFELRDDVVWSDGVPTTAEDVLFTYRMAINPKVGYADRSRFAQVDTVQVLSPHRIKFVFKKAYPDALLDLQIPILPKHILENIPPGDIRRCAFNRQPIGNGPYILQEWRSNDRVVFVANKRYFGHQPNIKRIIFRIVPDETILLSSLLAGEIDVLPYVAPNKLKEIRNRPDLRIISYTDRGYTFLAFNLRRPLFRDVRVREAIARGIRRQNLIDALLEGQGQVIAGPIMPYFWAYDSTLQTKIYNPALAESLLQAAGWHRPSTGGIYQKNGRPLTFTMKTNADNQLRRDALVMLQSDLRKIGIDARPEIVEWGKLVEDVVQNRDFDTVLLSWQTGFSVDPSQIWHSDFADAGLNLPGYKNARVDSLLEAARAKVNRADARPLWHEFQRVVARDYPYVFLFHKKNAAVVASRIQNVKMDVRGYLIDVEHWRCSSDTK